MKTLSSLKNSFIHYLTKKEDLDRKLFKVLGIAGVIVSLIASVQSLIIGIIDGGLINIAAAILSVALLYFVDRTGKYFLGYIITVITVFMGLFAGLFFEMGGMNGSMISFFAFSLAFSFLMFKGWTLFIVEVTEIIFYSFVCYYSIQFPESVTPFETASDRFTDQVMGMILSGIGIGLIFLFYIKEHRKQQKIAEEASQGKSRFLAQMSHELRTPLNLIMGLNELIMMESDNDQISEYAANAEDASRNLLKMVDKLLEYSHSEIFSGESQTYVPEDMNEARILIVDDNSMNLSVVKHLLDRSLLSVDTAGSADKCYEMLKHNKYQLILMDYMMPGTNGLEAMEHIRMFERKTGHHIPIIVLTADVSPGIRETLIQKGFDGYISKPVSFNDLERCLTRYIPKKLVDRRLGITAITVPNDQIDHYSEILEGYDVFLKEGIKFASGDFDLYTNVLKYFLENADPLSEQLKSAQNKGDLKQLTTILHSLKGNSKNIGATELYELCRRMEKHGRASDKEFVYSGLGLLTTEWNRVCDGIRACLAELEKTKKNDQGSEVEDTRKTTELIGSLKTYLDNNEQIPALRILEVIESRLSAETSKEMVHMIKKYTASIDFENAAELTDKLLCEESNGRDQDPIC